MTGPESLRAPAGERPPVSLIEGSVPPYEAALYVGGREGTSDLGLLRRLGIGTVINCAVNLDLNLMTEQDGAVGVDGVPYGHGAVRHYKLGLVDGPGNAETMMLAGYYLLRGALLQVLPDRASYPGRERWLGEDEWFEVPKPMLIKAARKASAWVDRIGHEDPSAEAQEQWEAFPDEEAEPAPGPASR